MGDGAFRGGGAVPCAHHPEAEGWTCMEPLAADVDAGREPLGHALVAVGREGGGCGGE